MWWYRGLLRHLENFGNGRKPLLKKCIGKQVSTDTDTIVPNGLICLKGGDLAAGNRR